MISRCGHERIIACSIQVQQPQRTPPIARDRDSPQRQRRDPSAIVLPLN
jgi:hypothetical protein